MNRIRPWAALCAVIGPHSPKKSNGRPPPGLERMVRIHFLQHCFNLDEQTCEDALYDSISLRRLAGLDLGREPVPNATSLLWFHYLLEQHQMGEKLSAKAGRILRHSGVTLKTGTMIDATIIVAPSSTKNEDKQRYPQMHQTRKGTLWHFGMKRHIGVDSQSRLAHSALVTSANVRRRHPLSQLPHGCEQRVYGDGSYVSRQELVHGKAQQAKDLRMNACVAAMARRPMKASARRTATRREFWRWSNMCSPCSSGYGVLPRCAIAGWPRMRAVPSRHWLGVGEH